MLPYPKNVYKDLEVLPANTVITEDMQAALEDAINKMPQQVQYIFYQHYKHGKTFKSLAEELDKSNSLVCSVNRKTLRNLRRPGTIQPILIGLEAYQRKKREEEELEAKRLADYNARFEDNELRTQLLYNMDVTELGLSTRATNIMRRANCAKVRDFVDRYTRHHWYEDIRNCGIATAQEIFDKLVGLEVWKGTFDDPEIAKQEIKYSVTRIQALKSLDEEGVIKLLTDFAGFVRASYNLPFFTADRTKQYFNELIDPKDYE